MLKITAKTTKEQLKNILGANALAVQSQDKDLFDRMVYADKMSKKDDKKVLRKDLADLVKEVATLLGDTLVNPFETPVQPVAENSVKKLSKGKKTPAEPPVEEQEEAEEPAEEKAETPAKKPAKGNKSLNKKKNSATDSSSKVVKTEAIVLAEVFPDTFELDGKKFEIAKDITNMGQLFDALEKGEDLVFAMYWTKRHIKQFGYGIKGLKAPEEFPMDLDIASCIHVADNCSVAYAVSAYTDVCYMYLPNDIEESDGLRFAGGVEYQIYRIK